MLHLLTCELSPHSPSPIPRRTGWQVRIANRSDQRVAPERQNHSQHSTVAPSIRKAHATNCNHRNIQRRSSAPAGRSKVTLAQLGPIFPRAASAKGASHPWLVTHGLTLRGGQLSWAILNGDKRVENRHFRMHPGWYALHTGAKTSSDASQLPLIAGVKGMPNEADLPHSAIIGAFKVTHTLTLDQSKPTEPWAFGPQVNVIGATCRLEQPVPHRGALSLWPIQPSAVELVREQLHHAHVVVNDVSHLLR